VSVVGDGERVSVTRVSSVRVVRATTADHHRTDGRLRFAGDLHLWTAVRRPACRSLYPDTSTRTGTASYRRRRTERGPAREEHTMNLDGFEPAQLIVFVIAVVLVFGGLIASRRRR